MSERRVTYIDRRSVEDRRRVHDDDYRMFVWTDRRRWKERRSVGERRASWKRVGRWRSEVVEIPEIRGQFRRQASR
ncbi:MAG: hypothetical protein R6V46_19425 [Desulfatiglandaceae bacterium]